MAYDTLIVGAGSAGAILATRLTEDPAHQVLLVEAGHDYPDYDSIPPYVKYGYGPNRDKSRAWPPADLWYFVAQRGPDQPPMLVPRGKVTGGSSAVNAQIFLRGVTDDYDTWAAMGNDEWGFQKLLPYLRRIETDTDFSGDFHGSDGPIPVRRFEDHELNADQRAFYEACRASGFPDCPDHNEPGSTGVGPTPLNNPGGVRVSTAMAYLSQSRDRPNLTIQPDALARPSRLRRNDRRGRGIRGRRTDRDSVRRRDSPVRRRHRVAASAPAVRRRAQRGSWRTWACPSRTTCPGWART